MSRATGKHPLPHTEVELGRLSQGMWQRGSGVTRQVDHQPPWWKTRRRDVLVVRWATSASSRGKKIVRTTKPIERLLKQQEAADLFKVHVCTLIRARRAGELRVIERGRLIRYRPSDLQSWLDSHTVGGDA